MQKHFDGAPGSPVPDGSGRGQTGNPPRPPICAQGCAVYGFCGVVSEARLPRELLARVRQPALASAGGASPPVMRQVAESLVRSCPSCRAITLEGASHQIVPEVVGPVLERFF